MDFLKIFYNWKHFRFEDILFKNNVIFRFYFPPLSVSIEWNALSINWEKKVFAGLIAFKDNQMQP